MGWTPACGAQGCGLPLTSSLCFLRSVEGEAPSSEPGTSLDSPSAYHQGPLAPGSGLSPEPYEHAPSGAYGLYAGPPGQQQQRARRPRLQHSTSILRKQAEEEAIKRSRSLSESYELSSDLQDKQVGSWPHGDGVGWGGGPQALKAGCQARVVPHDGSLSLSPGPSWSPPNSWRKQRAWVGMGCSVQPRPLPTSCSPCGWAPGGAGRQGLTLPVHSLHSGGH